MDFVIENTKTQPALQYTGNQIIIAKFYSNMKHTSRTLLFVIIGDRKGAEKYTYKNNSQERNYEKPQEHLFSLIRTKQTL